MEIGDTLPDFKLENDSGEIVTPNSFKGKRVILYFYPKDDTPGCTKEACGFRDLSKDLLKKGSIVVGVSKDTTASHQKFKNKYDLPFMLLSDPESSLAKALGIWGEKNMYGKKVMGLIRSTFIINKGKIESIYRNVKAAEHPMKVLADL